MPKDDEFKFQLMTRVLYLKNCHYILSKIEKYINRNFEVVDFSSKKISIEHILPQNPILGPVWRAEIGPNWKEIQSKYLHTIGNLTLTGCNSPLGDRPFLEKQNLEPCGFKRSNIKITRYLGDLAHWNEQEIIKRAEYLANQALTIWSYPQLLPHILDKYQNDVQSFDEDV